MTIALSAFIRSQPTAVKKWLYRLAIIWGIGSSDCANSFSWLQNVGIVLTPGRSAGASVSVSSAGNIPTRSGAQTELPGIQFSNVIHRSTKLKKIRIVWMALNYLGGIWFHPRIIYSMALNVGAKKNSPSSNEFLQNVQVSWISVDKYCAECPFIHSILLILTCITYSRRITKIIIIDVEHLSEYNVSIFYRYTQCTSFISICVDLCCRLCWKEVEIDVNNTVSISQEFKQRITIETIRGASSYWAALKVGSVALWADQICN